MARRLGYSLVDTKMEVCWIFSSEADEKFAATERHRRMKFMEREREPGDSAGESAQPDHAGHASGAAVIAAMGVETGFAGRTEVTAADR